MEYASAPLIKEAEERKHMIEVWKMKRLIQELENVKRNGTSFVSLYITPKQKIEMVA